MPFEFAGHLFRQLVDLFQFYMAFPISNFDSEPVSDEEAIAAHYARIQQLQLLLYYKHPTVRELALYNCGSVASRKLLLEHMQGLSHDELKKLVSKELRSVNSFKRTKSPFERGNISISPSLILCTLVSLALAFKHGFGAARMLLHNHCMARSKILRKRRVTGCNAMSKEALLTHDSSKSLDSSLQNVLIFAAGWFRSKIRGQIGLNSCKR